MTSKRLRQLRDLRMEIRDLQEGCTMNSFRQVTKRISTRD